MKQSLPNKLLAFALSLVLALLPAASLADSCVCTLRFSAEDEAPVWLTEALQIPSETASAACDVLNDLALSATLQDNGICLSLLVRNTEAADVTLWFLEDGFEITSSLLPGIGLTCTPVEAAVLLATLMPGEAFTDLLSLAQDLSNEAWEWLGDMISTSGSNAITLTIEDSDLGWLLDGLLLILEEHTAATDLIKTTWGQENYDSLLHGLRVLNHQVIGANRYAVQLQETDNDNNEPLTLDVYCWDGQFISWKLLLDYVDGLPVGEIDLMGDSEVPLHTVEVSVVVKDNSEYLLLRPDERENADFMMLYSEAAEETISLPEDLELIELTQLSDNLTKLETALFSGFSSLLLTLAQELPSLTTLLNLS